MREIALLDEDVRYASRLAGYLERRKNLNLKVHPFTDLARLRGYLERRSVGMLLLDEAWAHEAKELLAPPEGSSSDSPDAAGKLHCIVLTKSPQGGVHSFDTIYKYQPADVLARELVGRLKEGESPGAAVKLIGIHGPVGRCGKTGFALALGSVLSEKKRVLYLNLEDYSGFRQRKMVKEEGQDLSDLLYLLRTTPGDLPKQLASCIVSWNGLDLVAPAATCMDLQGIDPGQWQELFQGLAEAGSYEIILLDLGSKVAGLPDLIRMCCRLYVPGLDDPISRGKLKQFQETFSVLVPGANKDVLRFLSLPPVEAKSSLAGEDSMLERDGTLYGYVRRLLAADPVFQEGPLA